MEGQKDMIARLRLIRATDECDRDPSDAKSLDAIPEIGLEDGDSLPFLRARHCQCRRGGL